MNNRNKALVINGVASVMQQVVAFICGLILPRLVLTRFGSELNGLNASIAQFLSYITLLDGGIGGIVRAAYYKPLAEQNKNKVSAIFNASQKFYNQIGIILIVYAITLALVYPVAFGTEYDYWFVFCLVIILSITNMIQYFFGATRQILLHSGQRAYINTYISIATSILSTFICWIAIHMGASFLMIKVMTVFVYLLRPIILNYYVKKFYSVDRTVPADDIALKQRWSAFARHIAFYIHTSTDISVLTFFTDLRTVSIYSIHNGVIKNLTTLVSGIISNTEVTFGDLLAREEYLEFDAEFKGVDMITKAFSSILYGICMILITPFVMIYTSGITDTNYYQPLFAILFCAAEWIYCMGLNYNNVIVSAGHFKQTTKYAIIEASLNLGGSVLLVNIWGINGVVFATLIAMIFKMIANIVYMNKKVVHVDISYTIRSLMANFMAIIVSFVLAKTVLYYPVNSIMSFFVYAVLVGIIVVAINLLFLLVICKKEMKFLFKQANRIIRRGKKDEKTD